MGNERNRRNRSALFGTLALCVIYPFISPRAIAPELAVLPERREVLSERVSGIPADSFALDGHVGFLDSRGRLARLHRAEGLVSLGRDRWALSSPGLSGHRVLGADGALRIESAEIGYPLFMNERSFLVRPDQRGVAETDARGTIVWSREFPSILTAMDAVKDAVAFGLLDGSVIIADAQGRVRTRIAPPASAYACVYGLALSADGEVLTALSGKNPQRVLLYSLEGSDARQSASIELPFFSPLPAELAFFGSGRAVMMASGEQLMAWIPGRSGRGRSRDAGLTRIRMPADAAPGFGLAVHTTMRTVKAHEAESIVALTVAGDGDPATLTVVAPGGRMIASARIDGGTLALASAGDGFAVIDREALYLYGIQRR